MSDLVQMVGNADGIQVTTCPDCGRVRVNMFNALRFVAGGCLEPEDARMFAADLQREIEHRRTH